MAEKGSGELLGTVVVILGAVGGTVGMGLALSRTRLSPGVKATISTGVNLAAGLTALGFGMPNLAKGLVAGGVLQGGWYGTQQFALLRYLGSPDSKTALPAGTTNTAAAIAAGAAAGAATGAAINAAATGTGT